MNAPAQAGLASLSLKDPKLFREQCFIGGEWVGGANTIPVRNPATQAVLGTVPRLGAEEARRAIDAADRAWPAWRAKTGKERGGGPRGGGWALFGRQRGPAGGGGAQN